MLVGITHQLNMATGNLIGRLTRGQFVAGFKDGWATMLWHDTKNMVQAAAMRSQCRLAACSAAQEAVSLSGAQYDTVFQSCGSVHAASLGWPGTSIADCVGQVCRAAGLGAVGLYG